MHVTHPSTDSPVWIPSTERQGIKVKAGLNGFRHISLLVVIGLTLGSLSVALELYNLVPGRVMLVVGGVLAIGLVVLIVRRRAVAIQQLNQMLNEYRALSVDGLLYKLLAAQLLITAGRNLGELLSDPDDAELYEAIIVEFIKADDTQTVLQKYDEATDRKNRTVLMAVHSTLVGKIKDVVENLVGTYRMQHQ